MLYVPFVLGVVVAGRLNWAVVLLLLATTAMFISRESLLVWWRARSRGREASDAGRMLAIYLGLAAAFGLPLILIYELYWLLPIGAIGAALLVVNGKQATNLEERSIGGELLAICGLTLTAPAAWHTASGQWNAQAAWLWLMSALYFAGSVFYIKLRIYRLNPRKSAEERQVRQSCAFYHSFLLIGLIILIFAGNLQLFVLIAFAPALLRTFWSLVKPARQVNLMRAGLMEIAYSLVFLVFIALSFRQ
jgi:hypothetical protein